MMDKKPKQFIKKYEATYVYLDNISRINALLLEMKNIELLISKTQLPFLFTTKPSPIIFTYTFGEYASLEYNKKINWLIDSEEIPTQVNITFTLTANTLDESTLLLFELYIPHPERIELSNHCRVISGCRTICREMIHEIGSLIQLSSESIFEYESCIYQASIEKLWHYIVDSGFYRMLFPVENVQFNGPQDQVGTIISWTFLRDKSKGQCRIFVYDKILTRKKWMYGVVPLGGPLQNQEVLFTVIKLSDNETFLSVAHKFHETISPGVIKLLETNKIRMLTDIKKTIESINHCSIQKENHNEQNNDKEVYK